MLLELPVTQHNLCATVNDLLDAHGRLLSPCFHQLAANLAQNVTLNARIPISTLDLQNK